MKTLELKLKEILEVDEIDNSDILEDFDEWDSLTILTIIATVDSEYGIQIDSNDLDKATTIGELYSLIESKLK